MILEEQLKATLNTILIDYNHRGLSLGSIYYTLKDTFREFEITYNNYVQQEFEKMKENGELDDAHYDFQDEKKEEE